jgi:hypothetical protein
MIYRKNGVVVSREEFLEGAKSDFLEAPFNTANTYRDHDPLISEGLGCMKSQVGEMRETIKRHNIKGVTVRDSGQLEITSRRGRRDLCRVRGLADADAGYGD